MANAITVQGTTYTVVRVGRFGVDLVGSRGAKRVVIQNARNPRVWTFITAGRNARGIQIDDSATVDALIAMVGGAS